MSAKEPFMTSETQERRSAEQSQRAGKGAPALLAILLLAVAGQFVLVVVTLGVLSSRWSLAGALWTAAVLAEAVPTYFMVRVLRSNASWGRPRDAELHPVLALLGVLGWIVMTALAVLWVAAVARG